MTTASCSPVPSWTAHCSARPGLGRRPLPFETSQPLVFAIGDVRSGCSALADARATLGARGEYDPAKHGTGGDEPLTAAEWLEVIATGEVVACYYRHPADVDRAVKAGATWEQVAAARGCSEAQARQDHRDWAEGQHRLWTGELGGRAGEFGIDDDAYAAAIARAGEPDPGAAKAYAATHRVLCMHADDDGQGARWPAPGREVPGEHGAGR
jgi:hypothetical protein